MAFICESCRRAELTPWQRVKEDVWGAMLGPRPGAVLRSYSAVLIDALAPPRGSVLQRAYHHHREEYVRTGDEQELTRMLRHVTP